MIGLAEAENDYKTGQLAPGFGRAGIGSSGGGSCGIGFARECGNMVTKEQALTANHFHYTGRHECTRTMGPRGGVTELVTSCRRSGATKTWKRDPARFRVPVKYGLYESGEVTNENAHEWHVESECPLKVGK